jgi:pimeloyl-ACP methyl ester carboxylesterase
VPSLRRPDGVAIHWEERGAGRSVLLAPHAFAPPDVYAALRDELARGHRMLAYDPRGTGRSTRTTPASREDDVSDLEAVLEEAGPVAAAVTLGDASLRAASVALRRPDLLRVTVTVGATPVPPGALTRAEGPVSSPSVVETLLELAERNPRAGIRGLLELTNPGISPEDVRARLDATLAYCSEQAIHVRHRWFFDTDAIADLRALGPRLWVGHWQSDWSPPEVAAEVQRLLPESHVESLPEGPIARPDLTADLVRRAVEAGI